MKQNPLVMFLQQQKVRPVAAAAKVSTATITRILEPTPPNRQDEWITKEQMQTWSKRKLKGFVQSVVKLSAHAKLEPNDVLSHYKLPVNQQTITEWVRMTLDSIEQSEIQPSIADLRIGLFSWEPHCESEKPISQTWIARYADRLFGAIDPGIKIHYEKIANLADGISRIVSNDRSNDEYLDVLGGIFETPDRIFDGMQFVPFPGIHMRLGLIYPAEANVSWAALQCAPLKSIPKLRPVAVKSDAGCAFLLGPCNYSAAFVTQIEDFAVADITKALLDLNAGYLNGSRRECHPLVLEMHTAQQVMLNIKKKTGKDLFRIAEHIHAPSYPLGFAVSSHCDKISSAMLTHCQEFDLFKNTPVLTAINYLQLMCRDVSTGTHAIAINNDINSLSNTRWQNFLKLIVSTSEDYLTEEFTISTIRTAKAAFAQAIDRTA